MENGILNNFRSYCMSILDIHDFTYLFQVIDTVELQWLEH